MANESGQTTYELHVNGSLSPLEDSLLDDIKERLLVAVLNLETDYSSRESIDKVIDMALFELQQAELYFNTDTSACHICGQVGGH